MNRLNMLIQDAIGLVGELEVGQRLRVIAHADGATYLATHVWRGAIMIDRGSIIQIGECRAMPAQQNIPLPHLNIELGCDVRTYEGSGVLRATGGQLAKGERIRIVQVAARAWNHGSYLAGMVYVSGKPRWVLIKDLNLPRYEPPPATAKTA